MTLESKEIAQVNYFEYLSGITTDGGKSTKDIRRRIGRAKNAFLKKKKALIKTCVWNVVVYGIETWTIDEKKEIYVRNT